MQNLMQNKFNQYKPLAPRLLDNPVPVPRPAPDVVEPGEETLADEAEAVGGDVIGPSRAAWGVGLLASRKMGEPGT